MTGSTTLANDLLDVEAFIDIVGCSRAMAEHHIEQKGLASAYRDGMPLVRRADAEAFRLRYAEMRVASRELSEDTDAQEGECAIPAGPGAR